MVGILIEYQDINRLSIEWLRKKDGPCARELSTGAQKMGNDKVSERKAEGHVGTAVFSIQKVRDELSTGAAHSKDFLRASRRLF